MKGENERSDGKGGEEGTGERRVEGGGGREEARGGRRAAVKTN